MDRPLGGEGTVQLKLGDSEHTVHINRVRPLLTEPSVGLKPLHTWTPPLFHHETQQASVAPRLPGVTGDPCSSNPNTQVQAHQPQATTDAPVVQVTTCSRRTVRPVQRYGWT